MTEERLKEILIKHQKWLNGEADGEKADLSGANLIGANLSGTDLSKADLSGADLSEADLSGADLNGANLIGANLIRAGLRGAYLIVAGLSGADLSEANLRWAKLSRADLRWADLSGANLSGANLSGADLSGADLSGADLRWTDLIGAKPYIACPEQGSFIAFKKAGNYIIKLQIPSDAVRCSATTRKCRCSKAKVLSITTLSGEATDITSIPSSYDPTFIYTVGKTVKVKDFDMNRWNECSTGIHFFITRQEAVDY